MGICWHHPWRQCTLGVAYLLQAQPAEQGNLSGRLIFVSTKAQLSAAVFSNQRATFVGCSAWRSAWPGGTSGALRPSSATSCKSQTDSRPEPMAEHLRTWAGETQSQGQEGGISHDSGLPELLADGHRAGTAGRLSWHPWFQLTLWLQARRC